MTIEPRAARRTRLIKLSLCGIVTVVTLIIAGCLTPQEEALSSAEAAKDLNKKKNYTKAIEISKFATEKAPSAPWTWFWLGISYYDNKQYDEASAALHNAIKLNPNPSQLADSYFYLGFISSEKGDCAQAILLLKKALTVLSSKPTEESVLTSDVFNQLGRAYTKSGQFELGIEAFKRAVELKPDDPIYKNNLRLAENWRREAEVTFADKARAWRELAVRPKLPEEVQKCRIMAEDAFNNDKDFENALSYYEKGLAIDPLWPDGQLNAALIAGELHRYVEAAAHMKRYLELVPDASNASGAREKLYLWQGKAETENQPPPSQTP